MISVLSTCKIAKTLIKPMIIALAFLLIGCETVVKNDAPHLGKKLGAAKNANALVKVEDLDEYGRINFQMASEYANNQELGFASEKLEITLKRYPRFAEGYNLQGIIEEKRGRIDAAQESYKKAFELDPYYAEAFSRYATVTCPKGIFTIDDAAKRSASFGLYVAAGECALLNSQFLQALNYVAEAIRLNPEYGQSYYVKSAIHERMGDLDASLSALDAYHNINGYTAESLYIGLQIARQAKNRSAINRYESATAQFIKL